MKSNLAITLFLFVATLLSGQGNFNLEQVAHVPYDENLNDIWGYVQADGNEYAIVGTRTKTDVYSLSDPSNPKLVASVPGATSTWRDIKVLGNYAYVTTDTGADGVTIIDMTNAPDNITSSKVNPLVNGTPIERCHNLYIDTSLEVMFLAGCNTNRGVLAFDITTDPMNPTFINAVSIPYSHDVFVRDGLAFSSEFNGGEIAIYDINDIMNPVLLSATKTTTFATHNAWSSDDNQFLFTTDERPNGTIDAFDISDPINPKRIDVFVPESIRGLGIVPHNTHWMNNYLITSWYDYGVVITDVSNPSNIVEVGHFDTGESPNCWGVYPFLPSGLVIASDISNGLFVLQPTYTRASLILGKVSDSDSGAAIFDATIDVVASTSFGGRTDPKGEFNIGIVTEGTFTITFNHPEYELKRQEISLVAGETLTIDVELVKSRIFTQTISTVDASTGDAIADVTILMQKEGLDIATVTGADGFVSGAYVEGDFQVIAGKWGYKYGIVDASFSEDGSYTVELTPGYQDDFIFDYNWTTEAANTKSEWVRVVPIGTTFGGQESNPSEDVEGDIGNLCFVTGNGIGGTGAFDVDDSISVLTSPVMDLSDAEEATLKFSAWFFNDGSSNPAPNDTFNVFVTNGVEKALLRQFTENTGGWSTSDSIELTDFITLNDQVQIIFETADWEEAPHLVEAGVDAFLVELGGSASAVETEEDFAGEWSLFPNPVGSVIRLTNQEYSEKVTLSVFSLDGKMISRVVKSGGDLVLDAPTIPGLYFINIKSEYGAEENIKFVKQ